jgi:hypothetical protein
VNEEAKQYARVGLISGGIRVTNFDAPASTDMTVSGIQIKGTNSLPTGTKAFSGVGQIEAIGLPVAKVGDISYNTLADAITAAGNATQDAPMTITLLKDVEITSQISIPANVTLDGAGHSIIATTEGETQWSIANPSKYMLLVSTDNVTIKNLTVDGNSKTGTCGVQFYLAANGKLENVTVKDTQNLGLNINASDVTATGTITLSENGWGDIINVGWGEDITTTRTVCSFDYSAATVSATLVYSDSGDLSHAAAKNATIEIKAPTSGWIVLNDGSKGYAPASSAVAQIGETQYATLGTAFNEAADGDTIELLTGITDLTGITYDGGKSITLDLKEKNVTVKKNGTFLTVTAGTVKVTGNGTVSGSAESILSASETGKIEVDSGTFSSDVTKYCVLGKAASDNNNGTYTVEAAEKVTVPDDTKIGSDTKTTTNDVDVSEIPTDAQATVTTTAQSVAVKDATNKIVPDLSDKAAEAQAEAEEQDALVKLTANGIIEIKNDKIVLKNTETEATVTVTHEVYLEVKATGYEAGEDGSSKSLTLEIEPKYNVVATVSAESTETKKITLAENQDAKVSGTVEVFVELPDNFTDSETAYITHEHENESGSTVTYYYKGTIDKDNVLTFTNPNGFSTFTISTKAPEGSWINRSGEGAKEFNSLQKAVDDVQDNEIISFEADNDDTIYIGRTVTFTLDGPFKGKVVASNIYTTVTSDENKDGSVTYTCVYTAPSVPVYRVVVNDAEGGKIKASANKAAEGATIVLTPIADDEEGELETLAVVDEDGNAVTLTKRANGSYSFVMPAKAVTVTGTFTIVADPEEPDVDAEPGDV